MLDSFLSHVYLVHEILTLKCVKWTQSLLMWVEKHVTNTQLQTDGIVNIKIKHDGPKWKLKNVKDQYKNI